MTEWGKLQETSVVVLEISGYSYNKNVEAP